MALNKWWNNTESSITCSGVVMAVDGLLSLSYKQQMFVRKGEKRRKKFV